MDNNQENIITLVDDEGIEKDFEILFTYLSEDTQKKYVFFADTQDKDEEDELIVYFASYDDDNNLTRVDDEKEKEMLEEVYNTFIEDAGLGIDE